MFMLSAGFYLLTEPLAANPVSILFTCMWLLVNSDEAVSGCPLVTCTLKRTEENWTRLNTETLLGHGAGKQQRHV